MIYEMTAGAAAAKRRQRGPTISEMRRGRKKHRREQEAAGVQASRKSAKAVACKDGIATEFGWQGAQRKGSRH